MWGDNNFVEEVLLDCGEMFGEETSEWGQEDIQYGEVSTGRGHMWAEFIDDNIIGRG